MSPALPLFAREETQTNHARDGGLNVHCKRLPLFVGGIGAAGAREQLEIATMAPDAAQGRFFRTRAVLAEAPPLATGERYARGQLATLDAELRALAALELPGAKVATNHPVSKTGGIAI